MNQLPPHHDTILANRPPFHTGPFRSGSFGEPPDLPPRHGFVGPRNHSPAAKQPHQPHQPHQPQQLHQPQQPHQHIVPPVHHQGAGPSQNAKSCAEIIPMKKDELKALQKENKELHAKLETFQCKICLIHTADQVFTPCNHMVSCHACTVRLHDNGHSRCPVCQTHITQIVRVFGA